MVLDQDNNFEYSNYLFCWIMYGYLREQLHVNHFWKLEG